MVSALKSALKSPLLKPACKSHLFKDDMLSTLKRAIKELLALVNYSINLAPNSTVYLTWGKLTLELI
jgi:hypothetical protein